MTAIREATTADAVAIRRLLGDAFAEYRASYPIPLFDRYLDELVGGIGAVPLYVAHDDGALVGAAELYPPGHRDPYPDFVHEPWPATWASLRRLAVMPTHRRRGIARLLTDVRVEHARRLGAGAVALHTNFPAAQRLYRSLGWQRASAYDFTPATGIHVEAYVLVL